MRVSKKLIREMIKEERLKLTEQSAVWSGGVIDPEALFEAVFQILDQELNKMDVDRSLPEDAQVVTDVLERIAEMVQAEAGV